MALSSGSKFDPHEIQPALGAGGMGEVYRAPDTRLEHAVAIKIECVDRDSGNRSPPREPCPADLSPRWTTSSKPCLEKNPDERFPAAHDVPGSWNASDPEAIACPTIDRPVLVYAETNVTTRSKKVLTIVYPLLYTSANILKSRALLITALVRCLLNTKLDE